jgi:hypothetical protein
MTTYSIGWNFTNRGHYMRPEAFKHGLNSAELRRHLFSLIDAAPYLCRIWLSESPKDATQGRCIYWYDETRIKTLDSAEVVDLIMKELT